MKNHISTVLLALTISISLVSCSKGNSKQQIIDSLQTELSRYKLKFGTLPTLQQERDTNNLGIWTVSHYDDVFGDATSQRIVKNKTAFNGTLDNSLDLSVYLYLDLDKKISISFYDNGNNEKIDPDIIYQVYVKDQHNIQYHFETKHNYDNRIWFSNNTDSDNIPCDSIKSQQCFMRNLLNRGNLRFYISSHNGDYRFNIDNPYFLDRAYKKMILLK
jgi:hypothetical protein